MKKARLTSSLFLTALLGTQASWGDRVSDIRAKKTPPYLECSFQINKVHETLEQMVDWQEIPLEKSGEGSTWVGRTEYIIPSFLEEVGQETLTRKFGSKFKEQIRGDGAYRAQIHVNLQRGGSNWTIGQRPGDRLRFQVFISRKEEAKGEEAEREEAQGEEAQEKKVDSYKVVLSAKRDSDEVYTPTMLQEVSKNQVVQHVFKDILNPELGDYFLPEHPKYILHRDNDLRLAYEKQGQGVVIQAAGKKGLIPPGLLESVNLFCIGYYRETPIPEEFWMAGKKKASRALRELLQPPSVKIDREKIKKLFGSDSERK